MAIEIKTDGNLSAEDIKKLRLDLGWTQQHFAEMLSVSINTVSDWENGKRSPRLVYQQKLKELQKKVQSEAKS